jgi:hypothetical protein
MSTWHDSRRQEKRIRWDAGDDSSPLSTTASLIGRLAANWQEETGHFSSPLEKMANRNFLDLVQLGKVAIPAILVLLQKKPSDLFLVLQTVTQQNPVHPDEYGNLDAIIAAWEKWGAQQGYLKT